MNPPPLTSRLQDAARRLSSLLDATDSLELGAAASLADVPPALLCVAVGCLLQGGRISLLERDGRLMAARRADPLRNPEARADRS